MTLLQRVKRFFFPFAAATNDLHQTVDSFALLLVGIYLNTHDKGHGEDDPFTDCTRCESLRTFMREHNLIVDGDGWVRAACHPGQLQTAT